MSKHTTIFLYGKNSVLERLKANPKSVRRVFVQDNFDAPQIINLIRANNIPLRYVSEKELLRIKRAARLQGIVGEVDGFQYAGIGELLQRPKGSKLSFIFLDNLNDPHNLGSIIRITACFGGFAIAIPAHNCCHVNDTVLHVASGGENFVPVSIITNLSNALSEAKKAGYWVVGAEVSGGEDINRTKLPFPLCLILGSEGEGLRHGAQRQIDVKITLPMKGAALSFNVAMATAIFCHEICKQRSM